MTSPFESHLSLLLVRNLFRFVQSFTRTFSFLQPDNKPPCFLSRWSLAVVLYEKHSLELLIQLFASTTIAQLPFSATMKVSIAALTNEINKSATSEILQRNCVFRSAIIQQHLSYRCSASDVTFIDVIPSYCCCWHSTKLNTFHNIKRFEILNIERGKILLRWNETLKRFHFLEELRTERNKALSPEMFQLSANSRWSLAVSFFIVNIGVSPIENVSRLLITYQCFSSLYKWTQHI